jgi:hypothetical protein
MEHFSLQFDGFIYENETPGVSCRGDFSGHPALPRRLISFSGFAVEVCSLAFAGGWKQNPNFSLQSICIPSSIISISKDCFHWCQGLSFLAFELGSRLSAIERGAFGECFALLSMSLPAGLEQIAASALCWPSLEHIGIDSRNQHFSVSESSFLVFQRLSIVGHVGTATEFCIDSCIEELCDDCFSSQNALAAVSFEPDSRLRRIGEAAFFSSSLRSIVIPSSVEVLAPRCFAYCEKLSIVRFELNSRLSVIGEEAFMVCPTLETVWIPGCLEAISVDHFGYCPGIVLVVIETGASVHPRPRASLRTTNDVLAAYLRKRFRS